MTIDYSSLELSFTLSKIAKSSTSEWYENVHNVVPRVVKVTTVDQDHIPIAHIARLALSPDEVVSEDHLMNIQPIPVHPFDGGQIYYINNEIENPPQFFTISGNEYECISSDILITNRFADQEPLFWGDELPAVAVNFPISIRRANGESISGNYYRILTESHPDTGGTMRTVIAHNLWADTSHYEVTYQTATGVLISRALNQVPLFHQVGTRDLGTAWTEPKPDGFAYVAKNTPAGFSFTIQESDKIAITPSHRMYLRAEVPRALNADEPWLLSIPRFNLVGLRGTYSLPEWNAQSFVGMLPYIKAEADISTALNPSLLQVSHVNPQTSHSYVGASGQTTDFIYLYEYNSDDSVSRGITNDTRYWGSNIGTSAKTWQTDALSVVEAKGWIHCNLGLDPTKIYYADYIYKSEDIPFELVDLNPWKDTSLRGKTIVPYAVPKNSANPLQARAIEYLVYDQDGVITRCSQDNPATSHNPTISASGQYFKSPLWSQSQNAQNSLGLVFQIGTDFLKSYTPLYAGGESGFYIPLGEFTLPERLDEAANSVITKVTRPVSAGEGTWFASAVSLNIHQRKFEEESLSLDKYTLPTQGILVNHVDWNPAKNAYGESSFYSTARQINPAGIISSVKYKYTPNIFIAGAEYTSTSITIGWNPVPYNGTAPIQGSMVYSTDMTSWTTTATYSDLFTKTSQTAFLSTATDLYYFKLCPSYVMNGSTATGVDSHVLSFSYYEEST